MRSCYETGTVKYKINWYSGIIWYWNAIVIHTIGNNFKQKGFNCKSEAVLLEMSDALNMN